METDFLKRYGVDTAGCGPARAGLPEVHIAPDAVRLLPELISRHAAPGICALIADTNTYEAGRSAVSAVQEAGIPFERVILSGSDQLVPDETALGRALIGIPPETRCLLALGSGTVTDIARYIAFRLGLPFIAVPTAPSVDGFTSAHSPLMVDGFKRTISAGGPAAVAADTRILAAAPFRLKAAGVGDMLGKYTARIDWLLAGIVAGENVCRYACDLARDGLVRCLGALRKDPDFGEETVGALMEGLLLSGIAMSLAGVSRPASGSEHQISHFLEMKALQGKAPAYLHGEKVAFGTVLISRLYRKIFSRDISAFRKIVRESGPGESDAVRAERLKRAYGAAAPERIAFRRSTVPRVGRNEVPGTAFGERWEAARAMVLRDLPAEDELLSVMDRMELRYDPAVLGYERTMLEDALVCAKEIAPKYSILSFLDDLGILEHMAAGLLKESYR